MGVTSPVYIIAEKLGQFQNNSAAKETRVPVAAEDGTPTVNVLALGLPQQETSDET